MFRHQRKYYRPVRRRPSAWRRSAPRAHGTYANYDAPGLDRQMIKNIVLAVFFGGAVCWFFYFFFLSDNWAIKKIQINGLSSIPEPEFTAMVKEEIGRKRLFILPNMNILLFSKNALMSRIQKKYIVEEIAADKELPFTLNITIKEKQARLVLKAISKMEIKNEVTAEAPSADVVPGEGQVAGETTASSTSETGDSVPAAPATTTIITSTDYYYLDVNGIVVGEYSPPETIPENAPALPMVEIEYLSQTLVKPGDIALGSDEIGYVFAVYDAIARSGAGIKLQSVIYNPVLSDELKFVTTELWQGLLSKKLPLDTQMRKLESVLSEKIKDKRGSLKQVDLRVKDRVYFK